MHYVKGKVWCVMCISQIYRIFDTKEAAEKYIEDWIWMKSDFSVREMELVAYK